MLFRCFFIGSGLFESGKERIFDVLRFLLFSALHEFDIDFVTSEFGSKADILALFADSDRLLVFSDEDFGFFTIDFDLDGFGWAEGFADIFGSVVAPGDDVDFLLVTDFVHDGLDADAATTDEGTDWVNARNGRNDSDFGATTSFTSDAFDFDGAIIKLRNFLTEEIFNKFSTTAAEDELGAFVVSLDLFDVNFDTGTDGVIFAINLLAAWHDAAAAAHIDTDELRLDARNGAGDDGADFVFVFGKYGVVFGFAKALNDDLLGSLGGNAAKSGDFVTFFYDIAELGVFVALECVS